MADIRQDVIDRMMVKCGRRCCICRRFRPTRLQAHHIEERSKGGSDDEDNLIVTCMTCHTDVHSNVPFARRFTINELKGHRDALIKLVADGKLPMSETKGDGETIARIVLDVASRPTDEKLSPEAVQVLLDAVSGKGTREGIIVVSFSNAGWIIFPGDSKPMSAYGDRRSEAKYKAALEGLIAAELVEGIEPHYAVNQGGVFEVTHKGFLRADELAAEHGRDGGEPE